LLLSQWAGGAGTASQPVASPASCCYQADGAVGRAPARLAPPLSGGLTPREHPGHRPSRRDVTIGSMNTVIVGTGPVSFADVVDVASGALRAAEAVTGTLG
jgi:hypothetical protein